MKYLLASLVTASLMMSVGVATDQDQKCEDDQQCSKYGPSPNIHNIDSRKSAASTDDVRYGMKRAYQPHCKNSKKSIHGRCKKN